MGAKKSVFCIAATNMPETCKPVLQDPPEEAAEGGEEDEGSAEVVFKMTDLVRQAREKHEAEMIRFCEEYHESRGDRPITRPTLIPDDVDEHKSRIQGVLNSLVAKAEDERLVSVKALRQQLLAIWRLLNLVGAAVFDDISMTARMTAAAACDTLQEEYKPLARDRELPRGLGPFLLAAELAVEAPQRALRRGGAASWTCSSRRRRCRGAAPRGAAWAGPARVASRGCARRAGCRKR